ncbi:DUF2835 domain-containing protein [Flocculibacter collagenilyticus]|uniref:DUF2835 domain-containing protein n=1 Tax=Flocculibacter collagenilyticus TaxID=2744479 RepID=UPI0018F4E4AB|nr:DUF2835 domain-containing protein [Flocculibacter collagenilyticus]
MKVHYFNLTLSYNEWLPFYRGDYHSVIVKDDYGKRIQLPANRLRPFGSSLGIRGRFKLVLTENNAFVTLEKLN